MTFINVCVCVCVCLLEEYCFLCKKRLRNLILLKTLNQNKTKKHQKRNHPLIRLNWESGLVSMQLISKGRVTYELVMFRTWLHGRALFWGAVYAFTRCWYLCFLTVACDFGVLCMLLVLPDVSTCVSSQWLMVVSLSLSLPLVSLSVRLRMRSKFGIHLFW